MRGHGIFFVRVELADGSYRQGGSGSKIGDLRWEFERGDFVVTRRDGFLIDGRQTYPEIRVPRWDVRRVLIDMDIDGITAPLHDMLFESGDIWKSDYRPSRLPIQTAHGKAS